MLTSGKSGATTEANNNQDKQQGPSGPNQTSCSQVSSDNENSSNHSASWSNSVSSKRGALRRLEAAQKLNLILPQQQHLQHQLDPKNCLSTPIVITNDEIHPAISQQQQQQQQLFGSIYPSATQQMLFDSIAHQLNGHSGEVGLFTGLPSCTPASADRLTAINPFFLHAANTAVNTSPLEPVADHVETGHKDNRPELSEQRNGPTSQSNQQEQHPANSSRQNPVPSDFGAHNFAANHNQMAGNNLDHQRNKLTLANLHAANALSPIIYSPSLSFLGLSPEQEALIRYGYVSPQQHPLAGRGFTQNDFNQLNHQVYQLDQVYHGPRNVGETLGTHHHYNLNSAHHRHHHHHNQQQQQQQQQLDQHQTFQNHDQQQRHNQQAFEYTYHQSHNQQPPPPNQVATDLTQQAAAVAASNAAAPHTTGLIYQNQHQHQQHQQQQIQHDGAETRPMVLQSRQRDSHQEPQPSAQSVIDHARRQQRHFYSIADVGGALPQVQRNSITEANKEMRPMQTQQEVGGQHVSIIVSAPTPAMHPMGAPKEGQLNGNVVVQKLGHGLARISSTGAMESNSSVAHLGIPQAVRPSIISHELPQTQVPARSLSCSPAIRRHINESIERDQARQSAGQSGAQVPPNKEVDVTISEDSATAPSGCNGTNAATNETIAREISYSSFGQMAAKEVQRPNSNHNLVNSDHHSQINRAFNSTNGNSKETNKSSKTGVSMKLKQKKTPISKTQVANKNHQPIGTTTTTQTTLPNEAEPVKKKSRGGRKKKLITHEEMLARKNRSKERNRVAARRCRQKRKQFLDELRDKIDNLHELNEELRKGNLILKNELEALKRHHRTCAV